MFEVCKRCLMPNTRPETPFRDGVCQACKNFDTRADVDWNERLTELRAICDRHRSKDGSWDCFIAPSLFCGNEPNRKYAMEVVNNENSQPV